LENQKIVTPTNEEIPFEVDSFRKHCLLNGLDDIGLTLQDAEVIKTYEEARKTTSPWLFNN
jgi:3-isopropylmalate/(R)-2-methylmalate dehydratase small subunit